MYTILDMIAHLGEYPEDMTGKKVVVIGGGAVGLDVVEYFAPRGADVSIVEMRRSSETALTRYPKLISIH